MAEDFQELETGENPFIEDLFKELSKFENRTEEENFNHIQKFIIPRMNERRGRQGNLSQEEIYAKLNNPASSEKPGEMVEFCHEMTRLDRDVFQRTVLKALELADIAYYSLQSEEEIKNSYAFMHIVSEGWGLPCLFCILKYETRLKYGDRENYKEIEEYIMSKYLLKLKKTQNLEWFFN